MWVTFEPPIHYAMENVRMLSSPPAPTPSFPGFLVNWLSCCSLFFVVGPLRGYPFLGFLLLGLAVAAAVSAGRFAEAGASGMGS